MKIPLHLGQNESTSVRAAQLKALERDLASARKGDWEAKHALVRTFMPLLRSLAEKRASEPAAINTLLDNGKEGLLKAAKKFKVTNGADKFQVFALDFIEAAMDRKSGGFLSTLFGG